MRKTLTGKFKPKNHKKYKGDPNNITYRSSWELKFMLWADSNKNVLSWSSEEKIIPYISPIDNKYHRYFPDFIIEVLNKEGNKETIMIEVKPYKETKEPTKPKRITKKYIYEVKTWAINSSKWKFAEEYCEKNNWKFKVLTEKELF